MELGLKLKLNLQVACPVSQLYDLGQNPGSLINSVLING